MERLTVFIPEYFEDQVFSFYLPQDFFLKQYLDVEGSVGSISSLNSWFDFIQESRSI